MAQVTVQSGGYVSVPGSGTDVVALQTQIATALNSAAGTAGVNFYTASLTGGGSAPVPPVAATVTEAYITGGTGNNSYNIGSAYQYVVVNQTGAANDTVTLAAGQDVISGTIGSVFVGAGNDTVALGGGNNVYQSSGVNGFLLSDYVVGGSGNDTLSEANGGTLDGGGGTNLLVADSTAGNVTFISSGARDTIGAGAAINVVTLTAAAFGADVFGGAATTSLTVSDFGTGDTIAGISAGSVAATLAGSGGMLYGGTANTLSVLANGVGDTVSGQSAASMTVTIAGGADVVAAGSGAATVLASGNAAGQIIGGSGSLLFLGGAGTSTVRAGTGTNSIVGGSGGLVVAAVSGTTSVTSGTGVVTLFGGAGSDVTFRSNAAGLLYVAGSGNETLDASGSSGNDSLYGGAASGANLLMKAGSGNDTFIGGAGNNTLVGGSGHDLFAFFSVNGGGQDSLGTLTSSDTIALIGYSLTDAANMALVSSSASSGSSVSYKLSDGTQISFLAGSGVHII